MGSEDAVTATAPALVCRWIHGGPPLDDLTSIALSSAATTKDAPSSVWRSFTEEENKRLEAAWLKLDEATREEAWRAKTATHSKSGRSSAASSRRSSTAERPKSKPEPGPEHKEPESPKDYIADPDEESKPHVVHVSQDNLFSADILSLSLYPVFWKGARIGIQRATWFYPGTTLKKIYPVDPLLAHYLEEAYAEIRPFDPSYSDELRSAIEIGVEAEAKLKHIMPEVGVDVIFQSPDSARIYARNLPARLSKSFLTSFIRDKGHSSGGTLIYRGYDALVRYLAPTSKSATKPKAKATEKANAVKNKASQASLKADALPSDSESEARHNEDATPLSAKTETTQSKGSSTGPSRLSSLFSLGYRTTAGSRKNDGTTDPAEQADDNTTAEAMEEGSDSPSEPELAELVLIVHGIGQKLATTYDSFNIVHAINQLRKLCNKQSKDPAVKEVIGNKRLQFIPLQWRSSLQFDEMTDDDDPSLEAQLDNRFTINDIQVEGAIPFVRSLTTGVALDLAFYLSHHRDRMTATVIRDANRIYRLFRNRNPGFKGKLSLIAHSLGTALCTDILSNQPTRVPEIQDLDAVSLRKNDHFIFDVSTAFYLGSPVGYMFFLNRAQLIARRGRARTEDVPKEVALDQVGKYGCMAIDSLYNIYNVVDPVAVCLNATVDAEYAKVIKPLPINTVTSSLLSGYTAAVSSFFGSLIPSFGSAAPKNPEEAKGSKASKPQADPEADQAHQHIAPPTRPKTKRQVTSELRGEPLRRFERAEARMLALNPQGSIDFYLTAEGFSQYYDMLLSHASYWSDPRLATFLLTQLLASSEELHKAKQKREDDEEKHAADEEAKNKKQQDKDTLETAATSK